MRDTEPGVRPTRAARAAAVVGPPRLLPKARSLARNDAVVIRTAEDGRLDAEVTVRGAVHRVSVGLPCWSGAARTEAAGLVTAALADPGLPPGDLPDALAADLTGRGADLAVPDGERVTDCTCRAREDGCVHVRAVLYALVQRVDERPLLAVELRGIRAEASDPDWIPLGDVPVAGFYGI
ncbi:hypothetical protein NE236_02795 [Actinoallomurus purpureus]|uniref:hypothetical protein n=1 Tax=Actinoallomurus purpureus TaxID=478114 RepID=UPI002091F493|nr:hypothetical protein [Actinoallomurus purpureus]MCO6003897.1 hypothetical protein [Actinoallomurus purpureus]